MIAIAMIAEIENVLSQRSLRSLSARFPYNRSDLGVFLSYRSDPSDYMDTRLNRPNSIQIKLAHAIYSKKVSYFLSIDDPSYMVVTFGESYQFFLI